MYSHTFCTRIWQPNINIPAWNWNLLLFFFLNVLFYLILITLCHITKNDSSWSSTLERIRLAAKNSCQKVCKYIKSSGHTLGRHINKVLFHNRTIKYLYIMYYFTCWHVWLLISWEWLANMAFCPSTKLLSWSQCWVIYRLKIASESYSLSNSVCSTPYV
jgi:hypothetical protein